MDKTTIKSTETGQEQICDILRKNEKILEVVIEGTTIKVLLKKNNRIYVGRYKEMEFISTGNYFLSL